MNQEVVLDTNIYVQAAISPRGEASKLLEAAMRGEYQLVTSSKQLYELAQVLAYDRVRKLGVTVDNARQFIQNIEQRVPILRDPRLTQPLTSTRKDDYIVALAQSRRAVLVTRETGIQAVHPPEVQVVNPEQFRGVLHMDRVPDLKGDNAPTPPRYLRSLGKRPAEGEGRAIWDHARESVEQYRVEYGVDDPTRPLGRKLGLEPDQQAARVAVERTIRDAELALKRLRPNRIGP